VGWRTDRGGGSGTWAGCERLFRLSVEDSMSLSESSLPERADVTLTLITPGPME
jgi:hypothetical protein